MKHLSLPDALETFETLFNSAQHEMFKAEVLQDYTAVDNSPSLRAWSAGDKTRARELGRVDKDILAYRNKCLKSPAEITRVHVVEVPYTPYLDWEITVCYKDSLISHRAESILLVEASKLADTTLPEGDFWLFDNTLVLQWEYEHGIGTTSGAKVWNEDQGDSIDSFRTLKVLLLSKSQPVT